MNDTNAGNAPRRFLWTRFYEAIAEKLLDYRDDRSPLIEGIHEIASKYLLYLRDKDSSDGVFLSTGGHLSVHGDGYFQPWHYRFEQEDDCRGDRKIA